MYILDIDSSERDNGVYSNPNSYTVKLNRPLYNVSNIKLVSARIPNSQLLINNGNKQFDVGVGNTVVLHEGTWATGTALASNLTAQMTNFDGLSNNITVSYESNTQALTFTNSDATLFTFDFYGGSNGYATSSTVGTPASVLGFCHANVISDSSGVLVSNVIDLSGPSSIIMSLSSGSDDFFKEVYVNGGTFSFDSATYESTTTQPLNSVYVGRIITGEIGQLIRQTNYDDPIEYNFLRGSKKKIDELTIKFYYNNGTKLIPYDFGFRNHILKFEIECSLEKFKTLESEDKDVSVQIPPPMELQTRPRIFNKRQRMTYIIVAVVLVLGLLLLTFNR